MGSIKAKQDDLRRLMRERRENLLNEKIDSPFAKYNSANQLSCTVCNVVIKNNKLWASHTAGKSHKENISKQKNPITKSSNDAVVGIKRNSKQPESSKKIKNDSFKKPLPPEPLPSSSTSLASYSSSDDDSDMEVDDGSEQAAPQIKQSNGLPPGFFDCPNKNENDPVSATSNGISEKQEKGLPVVHNNVEMIPKGFFDDPVLDAKARNIEYKDPVEEEWERFQKTIAEENNVSKTIIEGDLEESTLERNIEQIDEQIHQWERSKHLQTLVDVAKAKLLKKDQKSENDSDSADEDFEDDDLLQWRLKGVKKS